MSFLNICSWIWLFFALYWAASAYFVNRTKEKESFLNRCMHMGPLFIGFYLLFHPRRFPLPLLENSAVGIAGIALTALGCAFAVWARIHLGRNWSGIVTLKEGHRLIRSGPYQLARHPIYTGIILAVLGSAMAAASAEAFAGAVLIAASFLPKLKREEAVLSREFGKEYAKFCQEVRTLIPFLY